MSYLRLNSFSEGTASTLTGRMMTPWPANWSKSSVNAQSSVVQTLVKASGKNATSTGDRPRKLERVTCSPLVLARVKSGAMAPTSIGVAVFVSDMRLIVC